MTFDAQYFDRFYESPKTRVYDASQVSHLARGVTEMITWFGGEIRSVLDIGAGSGLWRNWFRKNRPDVRYRSTDVSAYACERYGHEQRDIVTWCAREKFDLIVCQGVIPYLSKENAAKAIANIGAMARGFLYFEAITQRDLREVCDRSKTDIGVKGHSAAWYKKQLGEHFDRLGCGLFYARKGPLTFYELERA